MKIRHIEEADVEDLVLAERESNIATYVDDDFGEVKWLNPWTKSAEDVIKIISQRSRRDRGEYDTRTFVVEASLDATDQDGEPYAVHWVVGGFSYELQEDGFELVLLIINPSFDGDVLGAIIEFMQRKVERSRHRNQVTLYLRDRDEAGIRRLLPVIQKAGFLVRLAPDWFGSHDGWRCEWVAAIAAEEEECEVA